ncbi:MAG TPA: hypothetical protein VMG80_04945 [Solirubrobacteraceae bacterium]|nr:hypothetical protein [Solirubrobacteraceae bacterium]
MPELKSKELAQLRKKLVELGSDLNGTLARLDVSVQREYRAAERSVLEARRKAETHEGLLRLG